LNNGWEESLARALGDLSPRPGFASELLTLLRRAASGGPQIHVRARRKRMGLVAGSLAGAAGAAGAALYGARIMGRRRRVA
jgi:hypothetical protein